MYERRPQRGLEKQKVIFQTKLKRAPKGPRKTKSYFSNDIEKGPKDA
jgi:hypothetical protein